MLRLILVVLAVVSASECKWDGLKVKWGPDPTSDLFFRDQPITEADAINEGFSLIGSGACQESSSFRGVPYAKDGDLSLVLLYDVTGYIAGIQTRIARNNSDIHGYPSQHQSPPLVLDGITNTTWVLTAYFTNPNSICSTGRTQGGVAAHGTGDSLWVQHGSGYIQLATSEDQVGGAWTEGMCFPTMGQHYWYNTTTDMDCDHFFPVFLLYNGGELFGFGWALGVHETSPNFEHPPQNYLGAFFKDVPLCLSEQAGLSTMHIYIKSDIAAASCASQSNAV